MEKDGLAPEGQEHRRSRKKGGDKLFGLRDQERDGRPRREFPGAGRNAGMGAERSMNNLDASLSGQQVVELHGHQRGNIVVWIRIVGIAGAECRSGKKEHQAENENAVWMRDQHPVQLAGL